jgi:hypothetical protein
MNIFLLDRAEAKGEEDVARKVALPREEGLEGREEGEGEEGEEGGALGRGLTPARRPLRVLGEAGLGREVMKASTAGREAFAALDRGLLAFGLFRGDAGLDGVLREVGEDFRVADGGGAGGEGGEGKGSASLGRGGGETVALAFSGGARAPSSTVGGGGGMAARAAAASASFRCRISFALELSGSGRRAVGGSLGGKSTRPPCFPPSFSSLITPCREAIFCCRFIALVEKAEEGGRGAAFEEKFRRSSLGPCIRITSSSSSTGDEGGRCGRGDLVAAGPPC